MKKLFFLLASMFALQLAVAQETYPVNGVHDERSEAYFFTNATIITAPGTKLENASLYIRKGKVESVGTSISAPKGAVVVDLKGKFIYPSFIEIHSNYGLPEVEKNKGKWTDPPVFTSTKNGAYSWNEAIHPEIQAHENFSADKKAAKELRGLGFGATLSHIQNGIARGTGTLVSLGGEPEQEVVYKDIASAHFSFSKGNSKQDYPSSMMGSVALLRQTFLDAQWYAKGGNKEEYNISLDAWNKQKSLPQFFDVGDWQTALRADKVGDEFGVQYIIGGNGDEYQRLEALKKTGATIIVPLDFPKAFDVEDPFDAMNVDLSEMKHWELAPSNLKLMDDAGIPFVLSTAGLKSKDVFIKNLKKAIKRGLDKDKALAALTTVPAKLLGVESMLGTLAKGKQANFLITSAEIFDKKAIVHENWIDGKKYAQKPFDKHSLKGTYDLKLGKLKYTLEAKGKPGKEKLSLVLTDTTNVDLKHKLEEYTIQFHFNSNKDSLNMAKLGGAGQVRMSGWLSEDQKEWKGRGQLADGSWIDWSAKYAGELKEKEKDKDKGKDEEQDEKGKDGSDDEAKDKEEDDKDKEPEVLGDVCYPFMAYGYSKSPKAETVLFKNATVWTNEKDGVLEEADVLISNGKISKVGKGLSAPSGATEIDATGKHITSGIVDEHSHIAISRGVNEGTQASSAEVRIGDVVNSEDINIYRQLSGGVTTSQLLHGSANPIGGQSAIIKLRWGKTAEQMKFEGADGFIKFALGENVKQSNWGDSQTERFPQSRMGVEQVFEDHFSRARAYGQKMGSGSSSKRGRKASSSSSNNQRRDLELEALLEIINKKRFITCHSYVQSEITMLMRVADRFGFNINTFTHILEGYKIADKMKEHGVAGSTFSDWWAYKYEVIDAIPHNGAILHNSGVLTSFNSDDAEMARRLNQEAAKAVKYGNVSEEEALKFVTLNPAKMLHIDNRVGSIKAGKDADIVLWSDHPLSAYSKAMQTYVDGICYFDREKDEELRIAIRDERNRLIQKMLKEKEGGADTQKPMPKKKRHYHCDDVDDEWNLDKYHHHDVELEYQGHNH